MMERHLKLPTESQLHSSTESSSSYLPPSAVIDEKSAYLFRQWLKTKNFEDNRRTSLKIAPSSVAIPVNGDFLSKVLHRTSTDGSCSLDSSCCLGGSYSLNGFHFQLQNVDLPLKSSKRLTKSVDVIVKYLSHLEHPTFSWNEELKRDFPTSWERHGDLLLLPEHCFLRKDWIDLGVDLWKHVASAFCCSRIARRGRIMNNSFRSPTVTLLYGSNGWVEHVDNKIRYRYDLTKCMFSAGNITEKLRIARFNCEGETVVDLFAGIGYFTLPYLVHARANLVFACEWNPDAVDALKRNLALNGVADRCIVLEGDNRQMCPKGVADRVNLGLIPSSEGSWDTACAALKPDFGGILHIHGNVTSQLPGNTVSTTTPNICHQMPVTNSCVNVAVTPRYDNDIAKTSRHKVSKSVDGTPSAIIRASDDATCENGNSKEEVDKCHSISNDNNTFNVLQALQTFETPSDNLLSKTTRNFSCSETDIEPTHRVGGTVTYPAVNHSLPANQSSFANGEPEKRFKNMKPEWVDWAEKVCQKLEEILCHQTSKQWQTTVVHIEHVKSYAPHVDHIVADIHCSPVN